MSQGEVGFWKKREMPKEQQLSFCLEWAGSGPEAGRGDGGGFVGRDGFGVLFCGEAAAPRIRADMGSFGRR